MNYEELGFRPFYKNFSIILNNDSIRSIVSDCPGADESVGVLVYGYIDHEAGFTFEILSFAIDDGNDNFAFHDLPDDITFKLRAGAVKDCECFFNENIYDEFSELFKEKITRLEIYNHSEDVAKSRTFDFLDAFRDEEYIDDVQVILMRDGLKPEACWVRLEGLGDGVLIGNLLNEPDQDFGYHAGDRIAFFVYTDDEDNHHLVSDMNPSKKVTAEDLADGGMLRDAIAKFNKDKTQDNFIEVLEILRDSLVWIPCNVVIGEADEEFLKEIADKDEKEVKGAEFTLQDDMRMIPDILKNGDNYFFPVFSGMDEMGEYGNDFSKVQKHFIEAMSLAIGNEKDVVGIVIDAFSEPMIIDEDLFDIILGMKSRLQE